MYKFHRSSAPDLVFPDLPRHTLLPMAAGLIIDQVLGLNNNEMHFFDN